MIYLAWFYFIIPWLVYLVKSNDLIGYTLPKYVEILRLIALTYIVYYYFGW